MPLYRVKIEVEADVYVEAGNREEAERYTKTLDITDEQPCVNVHARLLSAGAYVPKDHADSYPRRVDGTTCEKTVGEMLMGEGEA